MIESVEWLRLLIVDHRSLEYFIVFFGVVFGGGVALFTLAFLATQKVIALLPFVILSFLAVFLSNLLWFFIGKTPFLKRIVLHRYASAAVSALTESIIRMSKNNHTKAFVIAEFLIATPLIFILYVAKTSLEFKDFLFGNFLATCLWIIANIMMGVLAGLGFIYAADILQNVYAAIGFILLIIIVVTFINKEIRERLVKPKE